MEKVLCYSTILDDNKRSTTLFRHPIFSYTEDITWPPDSWRDFHCWHCSVKLCEVETPVPLAQEKDEASQKFTVYGLFCGFPCAKTYLYESQPWSCGDKVLLLEILASDVYGLTEPITPAPPRQRLKFYGGDLSYAEFASERCVYSVTSPPFISYPEAYERETCGAPNSATETWMYASPRESRATTKTEIKDDNIGAKSHSSGIVLVPGAYATFRPTLKNAEKNSSSSSKDSVLKGTLCSYIKQPRAAKK